MFYSIEKRYTIHSCTTGSSVPAVHQVGVKATVGSTTVRHLQYTTYYQHTAVRQAVEYLQFTTIRQVGTEATVGSKTAT